MDEIKRLHDLDLEWGCITNLMDKICDIEDKIEGGWPELADMVADAVTEEGERKDPVSAFFNLYPFLWRLYYRLKTNPKKRPFNTVVRSGSVNAEGETYYDKEYTIYNYDYATFRWANEMGIDGGISNDIITVPIDKLTDKQRRAFERRVAK